MPFGSKQHSSEEKNKYSWTRSSRPKAFLQCVLGGHWEGEHNTEMQVSCGFYKRRQFRTRLNTWSNLDNSLSVMTSLQCPSPWHHLISRSTCEAGVKLHNNSTDSKWWLMSVAGLSWINLLPPFIIRAIMHQTMKMRRWKPCLGKSCGQIYTLLPRKQEGA